MNKKILKIMMKLMKFSPFFIRNKEFFKNFKKQKKQVIAFGHPMCD
jgi:hypothetical protein